jgi:hypothetical protein
MGNTYAMVNERKKEWLRQWAKIMLIIEQSVSRQERLAKQSNYSKKMPDGSRVLVTRLIQTVRLFDVIVIVHCRVVSFLSSFHRSFLVSSAGRTNQYRKYAYELPRTTSTTSQIEHEQVVHTFASESLLK